MVFVTRKHSSFLWTAFANIALGIWLLVAHASLGYTSTALIASDCLSGLFLILFAFRLPWGVCAIGMWLQLAPLFFWAPESAAYLNDTLVGVLAIAFSVIIPRERGDISEIPPGWSYNPSSWLQRLPVIALALVGWFIARHMASYQLGYTKEIWDPLFGDGTMRVIGSALSKSFPVSDAGLGAFAYTIETLMGCRGGESRWKTEPWMVIFFGILVVPVGLISTLLIISQPLVVGAWCGLCLITALAMILMIALTVDEVAATLQFLRTQVRSGHSLWHTFWRGEKAELEETITPAFSAPIMSQIRAMFWGVTFSWRLLLTFFLGIILVVLPQLFPNAALLASNTIVGALTSIISILAMADLLRKTRRLLLLLGAWALISAFLFPWSLTPQITQAVCGIVLLLSTRLRSRS